MSAPPIAPNLRAKLLLFVILHSSLVIPALAGTSASYSLAPDTLDSGGQAGSSANYLLHPSITPGTHSTSANYTVRIGFAGQLADAIATAIDIIASPLSINELSTRQLSGTLHFDDLSTSPLPATSITWSVQSGPITGISVTGLSTAAAVYQDTTAVVQGSYQAFTDTLTLNVIDTNPDNFGSYAADGLPDAWQVQYFGISNLNAAPGIDADFDGQSNLFEFTAGLSPTSAASRFLLHNAPVPNQPGQMNLVISPRLPDRTYTVKTSPTLGPDALWTDLTGFTTSDNGSERIVTDTSATGAQKFYRVHITQP